MAMHSGKGQNPDRIIRRKLSDQVLDRLRDMILSGEVRAGDPLPSERRLMERFGVGRPAVREALQALHQTGLITITHGERTRVNTIDAGTFFDQSNDIARLVLDLAPANLQHLKEVRQMMELGIIRVAAERASAADIADLRAAVVDQANRLGGDPRPFIAADMRFHTRIARITGNPIIIAASEAMLRWLSDYHSTLLHWSGHEEVTLSEHAAIVDALQSRDADAAVQRMRAHLDRSRALYTQRR